MVSLKDVRLISLRHRFRIRFLLMEIDLKGLLGWMEELLLGESIFDIG